MPKIEMPEGRYFPSLRNKISKEEVRRGSILIGHRLEKLLKRSETGKIDKIIGYGRESIVVTQSGKPQEVIAYNYGKMDSFRARAIFYMQRVYSTLFPHNFPHFYAAFAQDRGKSSENKTIGGTIRQKIEGRTRYQERQDSLTINDMTPKKINYPFREVMRICEKEGLPLSSDFFIGNFIVGADGGEYYVDVPNETDPIYFNPQIWDLDKFMHYMDKAKYNDNNKNLVRTSIERLHELRKEWVRKT